MDNDGNIMTISINKYYNDTKHVYTIINHILLSVKYCLKICKFIMSLIFSTTLGSGIVASSLECGNKSCPTSNHTLLSSNVTIIFEHSTFIQVIMK